MVQITMKLVYRCIKDECEHKTRNNTCRIRNKDCPYFNPVYKSVGDD